MITNAAMARGLYVHAKIEAYLKGESLDIPLPLVDEWNGMDVDWIMKSGDEIMEIIKTMYIPMKISEKEYHRIWNDEVEIVGKIDAIMKDDTIVDFKILEEMKETRDPLQLAMYQYLFPEGKGWEFWHFTTGTYKVLSYTREEIEAVQWKSIVENILTEDKFEKRKNKKWCKQYCSFYNICTKGGAK